MVTVTFVPKQVVYMQWLLNLSLFQVIKFVFQFILMAQVASLLYCMFLIKRQGLLGDLAKFLRRYWRNDHITQNIGKVMLWVSSLTTYMYSVYATAHLERASLAGAWERHPVVCCYVFLVLIGLVIYGVRKSLGKIALTKKMLAEWGERIKKVKWVMKQADRIPGFIRESRPATFAKRFVMKRVDRVVGDFTGEKFQKAVSAFCLTGAVEFAFRLSVILPAVYVATGGLKLW